MRELPKNSTVITNPRALALDVLDNVLGKGAYANLCLMQSLATGKLTSPDKGLATELVYGSIKQLLTLDWYLQSFLSKPLDTLPLTLQNILRLGSYQILYLDRIPARAAVNEAVEMSKKRGFPGMSGMVNAVLRNLERKKDELRLPDETKDPVKYLSIKYSHPEWMVKRWVDRLGFDQTSELCRVNNLPAATWLRTNTLKTSRADLAEILKEKGIEVTIGTIAPESIEVKGFAAIERLGPYRQGLCTVQDVSSMLVAHILDPQPDEFIIDACAAPGGKTTHIAELMGDRGKVMAVDIHQHKIGLIEGISKRMGLNSVSVRQGDATNLSSLVEHQADRVLVDAPCSGLGVLRRKPDARWNKFEADIVELSRLQLKILFEAAKVVKPGGTLVYSTCTLEPEENFEVIKAFRKEHPEFNPVNLNPLLPFVLEREQDRHMATKGYLQFLPHIHAMDGFFIARLDRTV